MALEKAIVASNIGWSNELIVDGYNGYKVNPKSHKEFANKIMALIDKNSDKIPEGDYLELCDTIHELRRQVKPPSFLLDQNQPILFWLRKDLPMDHQQSLSHFPMDILTP